MIAALMGLMLSMAQDPTIVWSAEEPAPTPTPVSQPIAAPIVDIPEWGRNDPYAWERAQCSPLLRGDEVLAACQSRVRIALDAALGADTPAGLAVRPGDLECSQMAARGDSQTYDLACGSERTARADAQAFERQRDARTDLCDRTPRSERGSTTWTLACSTPENEDRARGTLESLLRGD